MVYEIDKLVDEHSAMMGTILETFRIDSLFMDP